MLRLKKISYQLDDGRVIVDELSYDLATGKVYAITGVNGSGKSTLVQMIMGILTPTSGEIFLDEVNLAGKSINERANLGLALSFQNPVVFKGLGVDEIMSMAARDKMSRSQLCDLLGKVGLCYGDYAWRKLDKELSGGERKRIEIASVLAREAKVNIFDEPEAGIDLWSLEQLTNIFGQLKEKKKTTIVITHQEKILSIADEILLMDKGKLVKTGKWTELQELLPTAESCAACPRGQS